MVTKMAVKDLRVSKPASGEGMEELTESIRQTGVQMPIVATSVGLVIDGRRRLKAAAALGLKTVPVFVSNDYDEVMAQAAKNREHGECFLPKDHYRCYEFYQDTYPVMTARRDKMRGLPPNERGKNPLTPARTLIRHALGLSDQDIQAAIQFVRIGADPTHPNHEYGRQILARMDDGMRGSAASGTLRRFRRRDDPRNIANADEQRVIIENALINMATACEALSRVEHLSPKLELSELEKWRGATSPIKGQIQKITNSIKRMIEEKNYE